MRPETTRTIAEIRAHHPDHVRRGYRCDCTVDLLAVLDYVAEQLRDIENVLDIDDWVVTNLPELLAYIEGAPQ